jgi:flagellar basal body-associated protein FliL
MWMVILIVPMFVMLMGMAIYAEWNNRQARKYNEWKKQQEEEENVTITPVI